jgi:hypothetical protein
MRFSVLVLEPWKVPFVVTLNQRVTSSERRVSNDDVKPTSRPQCVVQDEYFRELNMPMEWYDRLFRVYQSQPVVLDDLPADP